MPSLGKIEASPCDYLGYLKVIHNIYIYIYICPPEGIGVRDYYAFQFFVLLVGRFSIGCGSEFRAEVAHLDVGSSDLEQINEKNYFLMKFKFFCSSAAAFGEKSW